jgi:hypothetical protein
VSARDLKRTEELLAIGKSVPEALANPPELFYDAIPFWEAFSALSSSRQQGMGIGYIPYSEVSAYLDENEVFELEERHRFRHYIRVIDGVFVEKQSAKIKSKTDSNKKPQTHQNRRIGGRR